ncbi:nucleoid-associated protein [Arachidicoccus terrestris]|uniref:nucleoid-associated protein n=1 Tax=Arachidicoccus terrestris TaxID=2875539 RepID=UPI001CC73ED4|nr:nucleoid-associated protein [Arachidicoccus terrestris]
MESGKWNLSSEDSIFLFSYYLRSMTAIEQVELQNVIVHQVGNPTRGEQLHLSNAPLTLNDTLVRELLTKYFLGNFNENERYQFTHVSDLNLNELYQYAGKIFEDKRSFVEVSGNIAQFLFSKSTHVKVKQGELYVAHFSGVPLDNGSVEAIGIFKSETKQPFLKVFPHGDNLELVSEEGININKLDKGCLIYNRGRQDGYIVCVVDITNKQNDTRYWIDEFLQVAPYSDAYHQTDNYLGFCKQFFTQEYPDKFEVAKSDQLELVERSMDYFKTNEQFDLHEFARDVIVHEEVIDSFMAYKENYEKSREFETPENFNIHLAAVKKQAKSFKSILKLDKNFHIYIHGRRDLLEKGFDDRSGKHYYKLYYDEES